MYITFLITFFSNASACYIYRIQKQTAENSIAIQACTIRTFGNRTVWAYVHVLSKNVT